jgi:hypothetical protein
MPAGRKATIAVAAMLFLSAGAEAQTTSINAQIKTWTELNRACRGGSGDSPKTWDACNQREAAGAILKKNGLCQGKYNLERFSDWNADTIVRERWIPCYYKDLTE